MGSELKPADWDPLSSALSAASGSDAFNPFTESDAVVDKASAQTTGPVVRSQPNTNQTERSMLMRGPNAGAQKVLEEPMERPITAEDLDLVDMIKSTEKRLANKGQGSSTRDPGKAKMPEDLALYQDELQLETAESVLLRMDKVAFFSEGHDVSEGALHVTNYRVHFKPYAAPSNEQGFQISSAPLFDVPLGCVNKVARILNRQSVKDEAANSLVVHLVCKDFRYLAFRFATEAAASRVTDLIKMSAFPLSQGQGLKWLFALEYGESQLKKNGAKSFGWDAYSFMSEFARQSVFESSESKNGECAWRVSEVNKSFRFSPTYPSQFVVPSSISDDHLKDIKKFRSKGRIPALSWYCSLSKGSIWRCSQPKVGIGSSCPLDEYFWSQVLERSNSSTAKIVDCRPFKNAIANKAKGMGYEDDSRYAGTTISFENIANIHVARSSMEKLFALIVGHNLAEDASPESASTSWTTRVENTGWLSHIRSILSASLKVARFASELGTPVLVHCSDGWDRTSQVVALAQLLVDPYFRTIKGFQVLIEKDWLSFGYKFSTRTGHGSEDGKSERSPCFLQFLDCVWQLQNLFPAMFEFNEAFLLFLADHLYSCKFGTFLCDNVYERLQNKIQEKTISIWDFASDAEPAFKSNMYEGSGGSMLHQTGQVCERVILWQAYYLRHATTSAFNVSALHKLQKSTLSHAMEEPLKVWHSALSVARKKVASLEQSIRDANLGN